ncbi:IS5 family transposase [Lentzea sp. NPDC058436]|uniref:IS5 family transposase n=1 Tax=Lentzea sp. NPDC058436 TaxID=3346499 RepID=UPI003664D4D4
MGKGEQPWIVSGDLWERIEPSLPRWEYALPKLGRKRIPDRLVLQSILFVLHTGIQWEFLPQELGFGCGMTCWRRLAEWNEAGVWQRLHEVLLAALNAAGRLDWSRAVVDSSHVRAARRGPQKRPSPVDRARPGSKHHVITEGGDIPTAYKLTGGNVTQLLPLIEAIPPVRGKRGHPRRRPDALYADRAYDFDKHRKELRAKGIDPQNAQRGTDHGSGPGTVRWVVERTIAWYHSMKRLRVRWERRDDIHEAFLGLSTCITCYRHTKIL